MLGESSQFLSLVDAANIPRNGISTALDHRNFQLVGLLALAWWLLLACYGGGLRVNVLNVPIFTDLGTGALL